MNTRYVLNVTQIVRLWLFELCMRVIEKWTVLNSFIRENNAGFKKNARWRGAILAEGPKAFPLASARRSGTKRGRDTGWFAIECNALNSGLLKQLFDRHYVLADRRRGERGGGRESMWLVPPFISGCREMPAIQNTLALTNLLFNRAKRLTKKTRIFLNSWFQDLFAWIMIHRTGRLQKRIGTQSL